jgi:hypothetical protein
MMAVVMTMMTVMRMVLRECRSGSRGKHHSEKGQGDLPHASFISRSSEE